MKKTVITTACAIALCGLLASCAKNDLVVEANVPVPGDGTVVTVSFVGEPMDMSRTFFDTAASGEA